MRKRECRKLISLLLILCMLLTAIPASADSVELSGSEMTKVEQQASTVVEQPQLSTTAQILSEDCKILNYVNAEVFSSANHVARLTSEETLSSYVFLNEDGTRTAYFMDEAVKFVDANGIIQEKDLTLVPTVGGYTTEKNDIELTLPTDPSRGITLLWNNTAVRIIPQGGTIGETVVEDNTVRYVDYYGNGADLVYTPTLSGLKEDIILESYAGKNTFSFMLNTGGLRLYSANGRYFLAASKTATERIELGDVVSFDTRGRFSVGTMTAQTVTAGQIYRLTLTVDEAFLTDPNTVYPVSIDPTLEVNDNNAAGSIEDVSIYQGKPTTNGNWTYLHSGYYDSNYTVSRTLFRLKGLIDSKIYNSITKCNILSAEFHIREASGTPTTDVWLRGNTGSAAWTESGATWNSPTVTLGSIYDTVAVGTNAWACFDITNLVKAWKYGICDPQCGFILQSSNETSVDKAFYSSEHSSTANRPYVVLTYSPNEFYSTFCSGRYYVNSEDSIDQNGVTLYEDDGLRFRANCYGYAFRFFFAPTSMARETAIYTTLDGEVIRGYLQRPGEFANKTNGLRITNANGSGSILRTIYNRTDLNSFYEEIFNSPLSNDQTMYYLTQLLVADGNTLGYTVTEYTGTTIPDATKYCDKRLIAVIVTDTDFHFYMQHTDNTWSHKPGMNEPIDRCAGTCSCELKNSNIKTYAEHGPYEGGALKFFYITKNAVVDYGHLGGAYTQRTHSIESVYTEPAYVDLAGNNYIAAKNLGTIQTITYTGNTDYVGDRDCYLFKLSTSGTVSFTFTTAGNTSLEVFLYDKQKNQLITRTSQNGTISFSYVLTANEEYVLKVWSPNQHSHQQMRKYTFTIG